MKKIAINLIVLSALFLYSCSDRADYVDKKNSDPEIFIVDGLGVDQVYVASEVKIPKTDPGVFVVRIKPSDVDGNITAIKYVLREGNVSVEDPSVLDNYENEFIDVRLVVEGEGKHRAQFVVTDQSGKDDFCELELTSFENKLPVSSWSLESIRVNSNLEYYLDGSASFDQDSAYGGEIVRYLWKINGTEILSDVPKVKHSFARGGNYEISLEVQDNDGAWSSITKRTEAL